MDRERTTKFHKKLIRQKEFPSFSEGSRLRPALHRQLISGSEKLENRYLLNARDIQDRP